MFLLALIFATTTGGGFAGFIFAMFMLGTLNSIVGSLRGSAPTANRVGGRRPQWRLEQTWERQRQRRESRGQPRQLAGGTDPRTARPSRQLPAPAPKPHPHAEEAVRRAGLDPERTGLLVSDLGLIVYNGNDKPVVHRESAVPDTADYVQPFAELSAAKPARGRLTFEIVDALGEVVYRRQEEQALPTGKKAVIPRTRLPVGDHLDTAQAWTLRLYANDTLLAEHPFGWYDPLDRTEALREVMSNDGELSADLSALMQDAAAAPMSLDDLLSDETTPKSAKAR